MKNKSVGVSLIIFAILVVVVGAVAYVLFIGGNPAAPPRYWYECSVKAQASLVIGGNLKIESVSCQNTGRRCGLLFSFLGTDGNLEIWDSTGRIASKSFSTSFLSQNADVTLQACSAYDSLSIKIYDDQHNLERYKTSLGD